MKIKDGYILPSAAYTISKNKIQRCNKDIFKQPEVGDLVYGRVSYLGQHKSLENKEGRIHSIYDGSKAIFVFGHRYAPDYYEGFVPGEFCDNVDLLSRSGMVGKVECKSTLVGDPTKIKIIGYVTDGDKVLNTKNYPKIKPRNNEKSPNRSKMILCIGTCMNSGKSATAAACCWGLSSMGHKVRASKVTGTASLKDILLMEDNGAEIISDFTHLGYPSTYMLDQEDIFGIFNTMDLKYANGHKNFWVVEIADGILQRETDMLLKSDFVKERIHKLIFSAKDAMGLIGGLKVLKDKFNLTPDAISGLCSSSPLQIRELSTHTDIPVFNSMERNLNSLSSMLI